MNLIYFTAGTSLMDGEIRRQTLRIPEVMANVRAAQESSDRDLVTILTAEDEFRKLDEKARRGLIEVIQQGLFERFCRLRLPWSEMIHRSMLRGPSSAVKEFRWLLRTGDPITVYVIGPGLDEIPMLVKDHRIEFIETIEHDPQLAWFWSELKRVANA